MGKVIRFPGSPEGRPENREPQRRAMQDGRFYDLNPPVNIGGELYNRVQCEYQVPNNPNEYVVKGIPHGATEIKSMVIRFSATRGTQITESETQGFN